MGRKFIKTSLKLRISNDISNLAFIRHIIGYYSLYATTAHESLESMENLINLKKALPS